MIIHYACRVEQGRRQYNDDRAFVGGSLVGGAASAFTASGEGELPVMAVVCDGCGGYAGGYLAAETVLETLSAKTPGSLLDTERLMDTLELCRQKVAGKQIEFPKFREMCTTVAGCLFSENRTVVFHAGDSRVCRFDGGSLAHMTVDHSTVQNLVDFGLISEDSTRSDPNRNRITRGIGFESPPPEIYVSDSPPRPGEIWLICSDGLWEFMKDVEIEQILGKRAGDTPLMTLADELVDRALVCGADDNISVCLLAVPGEAEQTVNAPFILD